ASVKLNPCASETSAKLSAKSSRLISNLRQEPHWLVVRDERVNPASAGFFYARFLGLDKLELPPVTILEIHHTSVSQRK
ncbi:hypothetical protein, partial [Vibrio owensii]